MKREWVIGSRESKLAVIQSQIVIDYLNRQYPECETSLITMKTTGDKILDRRLDQIGGKGLFVKELENALRQGRCDCVVHSLKDMPMEIPQDLPILCYSKREDPRDVLVLPEGKTELTFDKPIGTSSERRVIQLKKLYPNAIFESVRGNVQTRLRKLDEGQYSALILAAAGLKRLGMEERISRYFSVDEIIPAAGQGILAIQGKTNEDAALFEAFTDENATAVVVAERAFVKRLEGGCSSPIAAYACVEGETIFLTGLYAKAGEDIVYTGKIQGRLADARKLGIQLAEELLQQWERNKNK